MGVNYNVGVKCKLGYTRLMDQFENNFRYSQKIISDSASTDFYNVVQSAGEGKLFAH